MENIKERILVFTYGTLMTGRKNHYIIKEGKCLGDAYIKGFALYDLGEYPGIKSEEGKTVKGELYEISEELLPDLDYFESDGCLYNRVAVNVYMEEEEYKAFVYVYIGSVDDSLKIPEFLQPYGRDWSDYIWYVAYGSNLLEERMLAYIKGTSFRGKEPKGACEDASDPVGSVAVSIPHDIYFANKSSTWNRYGVAFLDVDESGRTLGRAWLITKKQFENLHKLEGRGEDWYHRIVEFQPLLGIPAWTFTKENRENENEPCQEYLDVIEEGMEEMKKQITYKIVRYE